VLAWSGYWITRLDVLDTGRGQQAYFLATDWANENLPANSTVIAMQTSGALLYYTKFTIVRWDQFTKDTFVDIERRTVSFGSPIYAVLFPFEKKEVLEQRMPGAWRQIAFFDPITIWRRDASAQN
jgi:hypothetical protein